MSISTPDFSALNSPPPTYTYTVHTLSPTSAHFPFLVGKYAAISLRALTTNPESFGVAYETECTWSPEDYAARLRRPDVTVFVCVAHSSGVLPDEQSIEQGAWVGMLKQIGPTPKSTYYLPLSGAPEPRGDANFHHTATWVDPAHRGHGIAGQLIEYAVQSAAKHGAGPNGGVSIGSEETRIRAFTGPTNDASMALYGRRGFGVVGKCTIGEGMVGNGNAGLPFHGRSDWGEDILGMRAGVVMERVVDGKGVRTEG